MILTLSNILSHIFSRNLSPSRPNCAKSPQSFLLTDSLVSSFHSYSLMSCLSKNNLIRI